MISYTLMENHIGSAVSENLRNRHTDTVPFTFIDFMEGLIKILVIVNVYMKKKHSTYIYYRLFYSILTNIFILDIQIYREKVNRL